MRRQGRCWALAALLAWTLFDAQSALALGRKRTPLPGEGKPPPGGVEPEPAGSLVLRVLSYNIQGLPLPKGLIDHTRYADIGHILHKQRELGIGPHVVAVQEAFHERTSDLVRNAGYPYARRGPPRKGLRSSAGLWILSEFPIEHAAWVVYSRCASWDCLARKGMMLARVRLPGVPEPVDILNTHMNADVNADFWTPPEEARQARLAQVQEIREFLWQQRQWTTPAVFAGDFNFRAPDYDYLSLVAFTGFDNGVALCLRSFTCSGDVIGDDDFSQWIDHQFYLRGRNPAIKVEPIHFERNFRKPVGGRRLSDHDGLEVHYRVSW